MYVVCVSCLVYVDCVWCDVTIMWRVCIVCVACVVRVRYVWFTMSTGVCVLYMFRYVHCVVGVGRVVYVVCVDYRGVLCA